MDPKKRIKILHTYHYLPLEYVCMCVYVSSRVGEICRLFYMGQAPWSWPCRNTNAPFMDAMRPFTGGIIPFQAKHGPFIRSLHNGELSGGRIVLCAC